MRTIPDPVDARAARTRLRLYALAIPVLSLLGGWCTLLQIASLISPEIIQHIPDGVRLAAFFGSVVWIIFLLHTIRRLPGIIDDILDRGLVMDDRPTRTFWRLQGAGRSPVAGDSHRETALTFIRAID